MNPTENNGVSPTPPENNQPDPASQLPTADKPVSSPSVSAPTTTADMQKNTKKNPFKKLSVLTIGLIAAGVLILGSAAAYFGYIVPNRPENIWKSALSNSAKAYDSLVTYGEEQKEIKGAKIEGNFSATSEGATGDANISGTFYEKQGQGTIDVGFAGSRYTAEIRAIEAENADYPDLYAKVDGLKGLGALLGASGGSASAGTFLDSLDGQWVFVDHTALEGMFSQIQSTQEEPEVTTEEAIAIAKKVGDVNREHLFSTDESKAVFRVAEQVGKEDFEGRESYKFVVEVNKENLKAYIEALKTELKDTKLPELIGDDYDKTFDDMIEEINTSEEVENETAEVWVDMGTKLIRNIRFTDEDNDKNIFDISLLYEGGDVYPLRFKVSEEESNTDATVTITLDTAADSVEFAVDMTVENSVDFSGSFKVTPHNEPVDVQKPEGAKSINELFGSFYSSSSATSGSSLNGSSNLQLNNGAFNGLGL